MNENQKTCDDAFNSIILKYGDLIVVDAYNNTEKTIVLVYQTIGLIGNMGISGFVSDEYSGDKNFSETIKAFKTINEQTIPSVILEAIVLHKEQILTDPKSKRFGKISEILDKLDDKCIDYEQRSIELLAKFIKLYYQV